MAMIICKQHGRSGCRFVCSHIQQQLRLHEPIIPVMISTLLDGEQYFSYWVCRMCAAEAGLQNGQVVSDDTWQKQYDAMIPVRPVCGMCFNEKVIPENQKGE